MTWWSCSPALGLTITESFLAGEWERAQRKGQEGVDTFRRAYLNQWPEVPVLDEATYQIVPSGAWAACADRNHVAAGKLAYCLDVDVNTKGEEWCSIGASDGVHLEIVTPPEHGAGLDWVVPACVARKDRFDELLIDPNGPAVKLISELENAGVKVRRVKPEEMVQASGQFVDAVTDRKVAHLDQPVLNRAVAGAARRDVGDGAWKLSRTRSSVDIAPLVAVALARWAANEGPKSPPLLVMMLGGS